MAPAHRPSPATPLLTPSQSEFIEKLATFSRLVGLPKSIFRIMGLLAVCQPAEQSALQIQAALKLSAGSVSTSMTFLTKMKLVERLKLPQGRQHYYRLRPDGFEKALEQRLVVLTQARAVVEAALQHDLENPRLQKWHDFYAAEEASLNDVISKMGTSTKRPKP